MTDGIWNIGYGTSDIGWREQREHRRKKWICCAGKSRTGRSARTTREGRCGREIDGELRKAAADVDMDAVNACEALLAELSGAKEETHAAQNLRAIREKLHPQRRARPSESAAVAALLAAALVFGGTATVLGAFGQRPPNGLRNCRRTGRFRSRRSPRRTKRA